MINDYNKIYNEAILTRSQRKKLSSSDYVFPDKAPGPGSYPIPDLAHARNALARVSTYGSPSEKSTVKSAVKKKFPSMEVKD